MYFGLILTLLAGLSTAIGSGFGLLLGNKPKHWIGFSMGVSAGVMLYISFVELLPVARASVGPNTATLLLFAGVLGMMGIDFLIPHQYIAERVCKNSLMHKHVSSAALLLIGLTIHNIPEGAAVFASSFSNVKQAVLLALGIGLHNIPEGFVIALPFYHLTGSKAKAFLLSAGSGFAEPLGGLLLFLLFGGHMPVALLSGTFAVVAGIMVFISLDELLPSCFRDGQGHRSILGVILGMGIAGLSLLLL